MKKRIFQRDRSAGTCAFVPFRAAAPQYDKKSPCVWIRVIDALANPTGRLSGRLYEENFSANIGSNGCAD
jgi:hypothetical protein